MRPVFGIIFTLLVLYGTNAQTEEQIRQLRIVCSRGLPLVSREIEMYCCELQVPTFKEYWYYAGYYLTRHMELLKTWKCPQLEEECQTRPYAFNEFLELTYDQFCNKTALEKKCTPVVQKVVKSTLTTSYSMTSMTTENETTTSGDVSTDWDNLVAQLDPATIDIDDLVKPCIQAAQIEPPHGGFGDFLEMMTPNIPFCTMVWCGFSQSAVEREGGLRIYDCMPSWCKANLVIMMLVVILLGIAVVVANIVVIVVFSTTPKLQNSQAVFKISLATADLLIGVFVLPTCAVSLSKITLGTAKMGEVYHLKLPEISDPLIDWTKVPMHGRDGITVNKTTGFFELVFDTPYLYAVGCVTTISFLVSIYTLMLAGFDRLLAVHRPLQYRRHRAKKIAIRLSLAMWAIAIIFSLLPLMSNLRYGLVSTMLLAMSGEYVLILYIVVFLIPLLLVITNIMVYVTVKKQAKKRRNIAMHGVSQENESDAENRLTVTLSIIVGVFTACALPATITSITASSIEKIDPVHPLTFSKWADTAMNSADFIAVLILMSNSLWNCFIYSARNRDFKKATAELYRKIKRSVSLAKEKRASDKTRKIRSTKTSCATNTKFGNTTTKGTILTQESPNVSSTKTTPSLQEKQPKDVDMEAKDEKESRNNNRDSVFQSFHINVNSDRFFNSVMRKWILQTKMVSQKNKMTAR
uniref:cannabinoid receptor type 1B-like n=1 Tax=Styela clava TaxID=7725 RepID=UPI001939D457|nr:cannabinoid receptor type 1B-like [Styela clava]